MDQVDETVDLTEEDSEEYEVYLGILGIVLSAVGFDEEDINDGVSEILESIKKNYEQPNDKAMAEMVRLFSRLAKKNKEFMKLAVSHVIASIFMAWGVQIREMPLEGEGQHGAGEEGKEHLH